MTISRDDPTGGGGDQISRVVGGIDPSWCVANFSKLSVTKVTAPMNIDVFKPARLVSDGMDARHGRKHGPFCRFQELRA